MLNHVEVLSIELSPSSDEPVEHVTIMPYKDWEALDDAGGSNAEAPITPPPSPSSGTKPATSSAPKENSRTESYNPCPEAGSLDPITIADT